MNENIDWILFNNLLLWQLWNDNKRVSQFYVKLPRKIYSKTKVDEVKNMGILADVSKLKFNVPTFTEFFSGHWLPLEK